MNKAAQQARPKEDRPTGTVVGNDNAPFDEKSWRKEYMKLYMRKKRERLREAKRKALASGL